MRELNHRDINVIYNDTSLGGGEARNIGIRNANTKFIAFLDCDDYWDHNKIESQKKCFLNYQQIGQMLFLVRSEW